MSFDGFSEVEIQKITKGKIRKPDGMIPKILYNP